MTTPTENWLEAAQKKINAAMAGPEIAQRQLAKGNFDSLAAAMFLADIRKQPTDDASRLIQALRRAVHTLNVYSEKMKPIDAAVALGDISQILLIQLADTIEGYSGKIADTERKLANKTEHDQHLFKEVQSLTARLEQAQALLSFWFEHSRSIQLWREDYTQWWKCVVVEPDLKLEGRGITPEAAILAARASHSP